MKLAGVMRLRMETLKLVRYLFRISVTTRLTLSRGSPTVKSVFGEVTMKNLGTILAVGITAVIVLTIGILNFLPVSAEPSASGEEPPLTAGDASVAPDAAAIQAAYDARETLLLGQIAELDAELVDRQSAYHQHLEEMSALVIVGEEQLTQLQDQENVLQERIDQLLVAQNERAATYESQRQQAYYQYQLNIQQLQAQLNEGNIKLQEALGRLGQ
jgi:hypothetical protein